MSSTSFEKPPAPRAEARTEASSRPYRPYTEHLRLTEAHEYANPCPYADLMAENRRRGRGEPEYELIDTGVFAEDRYFDVTVEYAKVNPQDILIRITAANRGPEAALLHVLPTLWYRNTWAWDMTMTRNAACWRWYLVTV